MFPSTFLSRIHFPFKYSFSTFETRSPDKRKQTRPTLNDRELFFSGGTECPQREATMFPSEGHPFCHPRSLVARDPHSREANLSQMASFDCTGILAAQLTVVECLKRSMLFKTACRPKWRSNRRAALSILPTSFWTGSNRVYSRQNHPNSFFKWSFCNVVLCTTRRDT